MVDISHSVPPGDIRSAAYLLGRSWRLFPAGTVHLAVVDPGVGTERDALALTTGGHAFVGPDNGILTWPLQSGEVEVVDAAGAPERVADLSRPRSLRPGRGRTRLRGAARANG